MSGESIIVICLVIFGVYGIFKFTKSEETSQAKILKIVQDIRGDITDLSRRIKLVEMEQSSLRANFKNYSKLIEEVSQEVDASQDK